MVVYNKTTLTLGKQQGVLYLVTLTRFDERKLIYLLTVGISVPWEKKEKPKL